MPKIVPVEAEQPKLKILRETFRATSEPRMLPGGYKVTDGFVTVDHGGHIIERVHASLYGDLDKHGSIYVYGFVGRRPTGKRIWRVRVSQMTPNEDAYINFGHMDHVNSCKRGSIWYAPKLWPNAHG